jgi:nicotinamidase-related amidase
MFDGARIGVVEPFGGDRRAMSRCQTLDMAAGWRDASVSSTALKDALLLVDVIQNFRHEGAERLLESFRERHPALVTAIERARRDQIPIVYANDNHGVWDGDAASLVRRAVEDGRAPELVEAIAPGDGDRFVVKPRYSAFDHTPLELVLRELGVERVLLAGAATEMCVVQSAIDAKEEGFKVTILADACATNDERMERLALEYAERIVGAFVERVSDG